MAGTCFEYGMQSGPLNVNIDTHPNNLYGFAKDVLRRQLQYFVAVNPFSLTWERLFCLYGNWRSENSLLPPWRRAIERDYKVFNMSDGEQLRDYLLVTDVAKHLVSLALQAKDFGVVNICSGKLVSVRKLIDDS